METLQLVFQQVLLTAQLPIVHLVFLTLFVSSVQPIRLFILWLKMELLPTLALSECQTVIQEIQQLAAFAKMDSTLMPDYVIWE